MSPLAILLIAITTSLLTGFSSGYSLRNTQAKAEQAEVFKAHVLRLEDLQAKNRVIESAYVDKAETIKTVYKTIVKKVPVYVSKPQKTDSECNLSVGSVQLLHQATQTRLPQTTATTDAENKAASVIREGDLIAYTHEVMGEYNAVMARCNALVDWNSLPD